MARPINVIRAELDAARDKFKRLKSEADELLRSAGDEPTDGQLTRVERLMAGASNADEEISRLSDEWRDAIEEGMGSGALGAEAGTPFERGKRVQVMTRANPWAPGQDDQNAGVMRSRAVTAIERCERLPDTAREMATRAIEADKDPAAALARYTVTASDPDYFRAFAAVFRDPTSGHYEWDDAQRSAYRRVTELTRAMNLGTGSAGGFLAPYELDPNIIISSAGSVDPMRRVARVVQTAYNEKRFVTSAGVTASWDAEAAEVSDDSPTLAQPPVTAFKGAAYVQASYELDEDTNIAREVGMLFADAKAQLEANAFTVGTGSGQPKGIITAVSAVGGSVIATATNVLAQADLYNNQAALPARWRPRARFMMNLSIINGYRQLPQASGLNYSIINDSTNPPTALGWQVIENSSMDGTLGAAANDYTVLSGDFQQYAIVDRVGTILVPIQAVIGANRRPTGERGWYFHFRTGGDVLVADAFRLTNHSS
ncbi:phage major capsid protein [Micromonospora sp. NPDC048930]|uniref:phage major capsid protein n=1 Tax=Micromonospora sp. NPDC048930 TaxID=3364261 RepID=UPI003719C570